jgi:hypothetical protein
MSDTNRAMQALIYDGWPVTDELRDAVALVTRVVRDDLYMAWQAGEIRDLLDVEGFLNSAVAELTGRPAVTGDTTEGMAA